ncbi:hypothetical protein D3M51_27025 [Klebsiella pneumoniae]|nr:hypothetical protein [Klebsiella pneumoniae]
MWSKIFKSEPPDVTPPGPFCCAAHRAATRLAPLTRAVGLLLRSVPQFPAICGRCPVESGAVAFHALTGIKTGK